MHPDFRRMGVGASMLQKLKDKLSFERRTRACLEVRETNLPMQLMLRSQGFRAMKVIRNCYDRDETTEDGYRFVFRIGGERQ